MFNYLLRNRCNTPTARAACLIPLLAGLCVPMHAGVTIAALTPSVAAPQPIGTVVTFTATATDTGKGPLTFQFNVTLGTVKTMVNDFNVGTSSGGVWTTQPFVWFPTSCASIAQPSGVDAYTCQPAGGTYTIEVVATDFTSNLTSSQMLTYKIDPLVTSSKPVVVATANPLVALFSSPGCATGSQMRVIFQEKSKNTPPTFTNYLACRGTSVSMTFEIAGMYASDKYVMSAQTLTNGTSTNGPTVAFTTGAIPESVPIPTYTVNTPAGSATDTAEKMVLYDPHQFGGGPIYANTATDLSGNVMWYYALNPPQNIILARPLVNGTMLVIESGMSWNPSPQLQLLAQIDLAGNILRETNIGIVSHELVAMGATDAALCSSISRPAQIGSACIDQFHHDAIQTLPGGNTMVLASIERIYPPGTQGDTSGLPVDILGDMLIILDSDWQPIWYFDLFDPAGGGNGYPQMPISRTAVLNETCGASQDGCPPMYLLGTGISPLGHDWIHANSLYYWPEDQFGKKGQIIWSSRNQDWVFKVDYQNGAGTNQIDWVMGNGGEFTFNNIDSDPWPWFSGQHYVSIQTNTSSGPISCFDNGNTRISAPPLGLGAGCGPNDCDSRGMVLNFDETSTPMTVTPVLSDNLEVNSVSGGNAQLLGNGNWHFAAVDVLVTLSNIATYIIEVEPTPNTLVGKQVLNIETTEGYRAWRLPSLYNPPTT